MSAGGSSSEALEAGEALSGLSRISGPVLFRSGVGSVLFLIARGDGGREPGGVMVDVMLSEEG